MLNVKEEYLKELKDIFTKYCPKAEIWAYGSRVKNDCHSGSDLDMVVKAFNEDNKHLCELKDLLNESDIPFLIDIQDFEKLPKYFQDEIKKEYVRIF